MGCLLRSNMHCGTLSLALTLALITACTDQFEPLPHPDSERVLANGPVIGFLNERGAHEWRGLRLAAAPKGDYRWRSPRPVEPWREVQAALLSGNPCPQFEQNGETIMGDEDCLFANVVAPPLNFVAVGEKSARLPVVVYIHGGGNVVGHPEERDWSALALEHRVVVISLQYRLGPLGWFRHSALLNEDSSLEEQSGNFAILDLVHGLHWVQENAIAFGGDPNRVTLYGTSAGAANILSLLTSPLADDLYHGAIVQSAAEAASATIEQAEQPIDEAGHPASSHEVLLKLISANDDIDKPAVEQQLASMTEAEIATLLRDTPVSELLAAYPKWFGPTYYLPTAFRDGYILPTEPPLTVFQNGDFIRVPIMIGSARDELKLFMLIGDPSIQRIFGLPLWLRDPIRYELLSEYGSRRWKARGVDELAIAMSEAGHTQVFAYRTDWDDLRQILSLDFKVLAGALHGVDLPFLEDKLDDGVGILVKPDAVSAAQELGAAMRSYWAEFAYQGDPGQGREGRLPAWQAWQTNPDRPTFLVFDTPIDGGIRHSDKIESEVTLLTDIRNDSRFISECDRCEATAGLIPGISPDYKVLPQACGQFMSGNGALDCSKLTVE